MVGKVSPPLFIFGYGLIIQRRDGIVMARTVAIGEQNFSTMLANNYFYIDKTDFIKEWWENGDTVTLITRPRRFGKTLTMNMLDCFFSLRYKDAGKLFEGLHIWEEESYRGIQGTYPVIFLSFADIKGSCYDTVREKICQSIANLYMDHHFLLKSGFLEDADAEYFKKISADMNDAAAARSLGQLSRFLCRFYGKKVILLLDEYDTPMQEAYVNGYWQELAEFLRGLFQSAFKTNPYLERAVMTGITRVSKEFVVVTTASRLYETAFGFTQDEVLHALEEFGLQDRMEEVRRWYDGFCFGECGSIYNPWSVINFLKFQRFKAYWANTSSNSLVGKLIREGDKEIKTVVEDLLKGKAFCVAVDEQMVFTDLDNSRNAVWGLLLASGYLKITGYEVTDPQLGDEGLAYWLAFTNLEIVVIFKKLVQGFFAPCSSDYNDFIKALLADDLKNMNAYMNRVALSVVSFFDTGSGPSQKTEPERFYHGLVLGMMIDLGGRYSMTSNRESGFGRYDVLLEPLNAADNGIIFEFKVRNEEDGEESLEDTAESALAQILEKRYAAVLAAKCGRERIRIYGFAFQGKQVLIKGGPIRNYE